MLMEQTEPSRGLSYDPKLKKMKKVDMLLLEQKRIKITRIKLAETKLQDI